MSVQLFRFNRLSLQIQIYRTRQTGIQFTGEIVCLRMSGRLNYITWVFLMCINMANTSVLFLEGVC